ncbi:MAG TPA: BadF/BadG/BcrA/BcrD ATPase family protein [Bryobacteraceae bacterium]|nr:BadF/BadG/BcrA/BcrD ATPase family protein [Bryobacteraceae bacterium]
MSGGPADKEDILREILHTGRLTLTIDAVIALSGATAGAPGIITIAGTGSIAFGRNAAGQAMRAGGWGYVFGDEGGAFDIARQALRAILRQEEGWGPATTLRDPFLALGGATSANDLLHRFYTTDFPRARVATFARMVDEAAQKNDAVAQGILRKAASDLALLTGAVRRKLFREADPVRLAYIGGVFRSALLLEHFRSLAGQEVAPPLYAPAAGALIEAYRATGLSPALSGLPEFKT